MARPRKVNIKDLINDLDDYIATADPPIIAEYAHLHGITRQRLYQLADEEKKHGRQQLFDALKKLSEAKEIALERGGLTEKYHPSVAIFSLKQLGWRDKPEASENTDDNISAETRQAVEEAMKHGTESADSDAGTGGSNTAVTPESA